MFTTVRVKCHDQALQVNAPRLASGGVNEIQIAAEFCPLWDGMGKTAVFFTDASSAYHVLMVDDTCIVPAEVTAAPGAVYFGIIGAGDDRVRTSEVKRLSLVQGPITEGEAPADPTPDIYSQLLAYYGETRDQIESLYLCATDNGDGIVTLDFRNDGKTALRDISTGKLTSKEKAAFSSLVGVDFVGSEIFKASNNLPGLLHWAYSNARVDVSPYFLSVQYTFQKMFDWYNKAENGYKRKLLPETKENKNYLAMLLPGSYGGGKAMQAHGYFYTLTAEDYQIGDIFCMRYETYLDGKYADSCYYMALCVAEDTFLLYQDYGAGEDATYASNTRVINHAGITDILNSTTSIYHYVMRPENIAIADTVSLEKRVAALEAKLAAL